jgi:hypothetical protein
MLATESVNIVVVHAKLEFADAQNRLEQSIHDCLCCLLLFTMCDRPRSATINEQLTLFAAQR